MSLPYYVLLLIAIVSVLPVNHGAEDVRVVANINRVDCHPQAKISPEECRRRGCLFEESKSEGPPACHIDPDALHYVFSGVVPAEQNPWSIMNKYLVSVRVEVRSNFSVSGDPPIKALLVEFQPFSTRVMGFRIRDADNERYEVPRSVVKLAVPRRLNKNFYRIEYVKDPAKPFSFKILRDSTNATIFDTTLGGMIFEDKFLQIVTKLASSHVYGFGENRRSSFRHKMDWNTVPLFSRHAPANLQNDNRNYAGFHPFYMVVENEGNAHGVFLLNSNAIEYKFSPAPALTLRTMGGVLEFVICMGATPNDVIIEYTQVIGRPEIPPYWALGLHETSLVEDANDTIETMKVAKVPLDVLHIRSRESDREWDITVLKDTLLPAVRNLHINRGQALVAVPPYIRVDAEDEVVRAAYQDGLWKDVFVNWPNGAENNSELNPESVGPSSTLFGTDKSQLLVAFVDFFKPNAIEWWNKQLTSLHAQIPWDGFSLQHNEPFAAETNAPRSILRCPKNNSLDNPPYLSAAATVWNSTSNLLSDESICMSAEHKIDGVIRSHYDVHNIYGLAQSIATKKIAQNLTGKRSFIMTSSNFASSGTVAGIWHRTSLKESPEKAIHRSIIAALDFNMFGMTVAGVDAISIPNDENVCKKWQAFSIFQVLAKSIVNSCVDAAGKPFPSVIDTAKTAMAARYLLLPYLHTLFFHGWMEGEPIIRPLFHEYNTRYHDKNVLDIDTQFLWGSALMFVPNLSYNGTTHRVYFPLDTFYSLHSVYFYQHQRIQGEAKHIEFPFVNDLDISAFLRAGYIIPVQSPKGRLEKPSANAREAHAEPFGLIIASSRHFDGSAVANGNLFWDDGESIDTIEKQDYMSWFIYNRWQEGNISRALLDYDVERNILPEATKTLMKFDTFIILGYDNSQNIEPLELRLNGQKLEDKSKYTVNYSAARESLTINLVIPAVTGFKLEILHPL